MTMLTEFSNALEKPPFQMRSGITSYISQYEVCLGCGATAVLARAKPLEATVAVIFMSEGVCWYPAAMSTLLLRTKPPRDPIWSLRRHSFILVAAATCRICQ